MTPERQKWWDSLPAEEKRIRKIIIKRKCRIRFLKKNMTVVTVECKQNNWSSSIVKKVFATYKREMRKMKTNIKDLRKQIAMNVLHVHTGEEPYCCPTCRESMNWRDAYQKEFNCRGCGQKLRWK